MSNNPSAPQNPMASTEGLVLLEYTGHAILPMSFFPPSNYQYKFGGDDVFGYVLASDVEWFLAQKTFRVSEPLTPPDESEPTSADTALEKDIVDAAEAFVESSTPTKTKGKKKA